jgi:hypothetical protein
VFSFFPRSAPKDADLWELQFGDLDIKGYEIPVLFQSVFCLQLLKVGVGVFVESTALGGVVCKMVVAADV